MSYLKVDHDPDTEQNGTGVCCLPPGTEEAMSYEGIPYQAVTTDLDCFNLYRVPKGLVKANLGINRVWLVASPSRGQLIIRYCFHAVGVSPCTIWLPYGCG